MISYFDGKFVDDAEAVVSVRTRALNYGLGCFGGIRGYLAEDGEQLNVFRVADHMRRLEHSARVLHMQLPGGQANACELVLELLRKNEVRYDVYVRPLLLNGSTKLAPVMKAEDTIMTIYCLPLQRYMNKDAIDVCVSSWRRATDNALPARTKATGLYINSALARKEAHDNGYDEAIFLTEYGKVSEGSAEHVFIVRDGVLYTPPSTEDNLDGITRRSLITLATEDLGLKVVERVIGRTELYVSDELFLCGTGAQIQPVRTVDKRTVGDGEIGPITKKLHEHFSAVVRGKVPHRRAWLTPVWA
jgi:branched-chain amino acid aminotransferase